MRGVYRITNKINNKVYIGESLNIERRWEEHKKELNNKTHKNYKLQKDYNKYGHEAFEFEVIATLDKDIPKFVDKFINIIFEDIYILKYNSIKEGYNIERTFTEVFLNENKNIRGGNKRSRTMLKVYFKRYKQGEIFIQDGVIYYLPKKNNKARKLCLSKLPTLKQVVLEELKLDIKPKELKQLLYDNVLTNNGKVKKKYRDCFILVPHNGKNILKVTPKGKELLQYLIKNKTLEGFKK